MKQIIVNNISTSYYITEDGKVFNQNTQKFLKGQENYKNGYFSYNLTFPDGSKHRLYAHRLVAEAYLAQEKTLEKTEVNHIDGNKLNNSVDNLEWVTPSENQRHALKAELRKYNHVFCFNVEKKLVAEYKNIAEASESTGVSISQISKALNADKKTLAGGFYWSKSKELGETVFYPNTGKAKEVYQYNLSGKFIKSYSSTGEAARALGMKTHAHIGECCRGKIKSCGGFIWRYAEDIVSPSDESQSDTSEVSKD